MVQFLCIQKIAGCCRSGGSFIGTQYYPTHDLVRIAPKSCDQISALLENEISKTAEKLGTTFHKTTSLKRVHHHKKEKEFKTISPLLVEFQIVNPDIRRSQGPSQ